MSIGVDVPWIPPKCSKRSVFGHSDKTCYVEPVGSGKTVAVDCGKVVAHGKAKKIRPVAQVVAPGSSNSGLVCLHAVAVTPFLIKSGKGSIRGFCNQCVVLTGVTEAVVAASTVAFVGGVTGSNVVGVGLNPSAPAAVDVGVISFDIEVCG
ncbi:hypothetical protein V6N12_035531 [Hibiscus sabdariffa]|uniref:Uncharacterized protein n=1 Tax=Hibiscus sabdariffa TaxID=183260 RepID=A0ABR2EN14_9ROSI